VLRRIAVEVLGEEKARNVWSRLDIIGDIAIIKLPITGGVGVEDLQRIAVKLVDRVNYIKSVWLAATPVGGSYKLRTYIHLAGEERSITVYREHGCSFKVDIRRVFITPRLSYEHRRIADQVRDGEVIVNMFAGVGLFSIIIACRARPRRVYSIDINEHAYKLMVENVRLNRVEGIVIPIHGDAGEVISSKLRGVADRVLMPLPELALDYLRYALMSLKDSGVIHVYLHIDSPKGVNPVQRSWNIIRDRIPYNATLLNGRIVRPIGPRRYQVALDVGVDKGG